MPEPCAVVLLPEARADLRRLRSLAPRFIKALQTLAARPERRHQLRGALATCRLLVLSYEGRGYRAVYVYDQAKRRCLVFAVGEHATNYDVALKRFPPSPPAEESKQSESQR